MEVEDFELRATRVRAMLQDEEVTPTFAHELDKLLRRYEGLIFDRHVQTGVTQARVRAAEAMRREAKKLMSRATVTIHNQRAEIRRLLREREES